MKKCLSLTVALMLFIGTATSVSAAGNISTAKTAYEEAVKAEIGAKAVYKEANKEYEKGSEGFFRWVADNSSIAWQKEDANTALQALEKTAFGEYTKIGDAKDSTNLDNMKAAVELLPVLQQKRAGDDNFPGIPAPMIRNEHMARAQINANASAYTMGHMPEDEGFSTSESNECLAWGYSDPFDGWYDAEKENYDKMRAHFLKKYNVDINDDADQDALIDQLTWDTYHEEYSQFGEIGHYCNVCCGETATYTSDGVIYGMADIVIFGLGLSKKEDMACHCLVGDAFEKYDTAYTVSEYMTLFNTYYDSVYPEKELAAYKKATKNAKSALSKLKTKMVVKKPTAKRTVKKVLVKWKKVSGVSGYQISVSPSKTKTKIKATVGKNKIKKTIKISKAKKQYVKVRSYTKVGQKTIYGKWSRVRATK